MTMDVHAKIAHAFATNAPELILSGMGLTALPESIGALDALRVLYLDEYSNKELLDVIRGLPWITSFRNRLEVLPESIGQLGALECLCIRNNPLTTLPESFGNLHALRRLNLSNNRLTSLPESIGALYALEQLWIFKNQLTALPVSFGELYSLINLSIHHNPLEVFMGRFGAPSVANVRARWARHRVLCAALGHLPWELREMIAEDEIAGTSVGVL